MGYRILDGLVSYLRAHAMPFDPTIEWYYRCAARLGAKPSPIKLKKRRCVGLMILLRLLLTFNATSLLIVIYQIKDPFLLTSLHGVSRHTFNVILLAAPVILTWLSILFCRCLGRDSFKQGQITSIEYANNAFLPSYLGYFFVALSIPNLETLVFVYLILFAFTFVSQALYFNPIFLLLGFKFYNVTTAKGTVIFLISKEEYRMPEQVEIDQARRINGYTFLEMN